MRINNLFPGKIRVQSMRLKMTVIFFAVVLFTIFLISGILYDKFATVITNSSTSTLMKSMNSTVLRLNSIFNGIETVTVPFIGNKMLTRFLEDTESDVFETRDFIEYVKKVAAANPYIYNIELYSTKKDIFITSRNEIIYKTFPIEIYDWYNNALKAQGAPVWNNTYFFKQYYSVDKTDQILISISRQILRNYFGEPLGVVNISLQESVIAEALRDIKLYPSQEVLIINKDELVLSHSDDSILSSNIIAAEGKISATDLNPFIGDIKNNLFSNKSGILELKFKGKDLIVLFNTIDISNWKLLSIVDKAEMLSTFNTIKKYIMIASFIALILGALFIIIITGIIYKPISILKSAMQKAREGKFDVCITDKRKDEFRELYESFNSMIETIDKLVNELYEKKLLAAEAELKALQANINPHFIYNIFESMIWMIELGNMDDLKKMVISLSKFYRLVLSEGKDIITVKEVAEQIENYITIQKIRYKDRLYVNINIDNKLYDYEMLNILLQPIIENAIIHGIQGKSGPGCIKINGYMEANDIMVFTVEDDGIGIQEDKLEEIKKNLIDSTYANKLKASYIGTLKT